VSLFILFEANLLIDDHPVPLQKCPSPFPVLDRLAPGPTLHDPLSNRREDDCLPEGRGSTSDPFILVLAGLFFRAGAAFQTIDIFPF